MTPWFSYIVTDIQISIQAEDYSLRAIKLFFIIPTGSKALYKHFSIVEYGYSVIVCTVSAANTKPLELTA